MKQDRPDNLPRGKWVLVVLLCLAPVVAVGAWRALQSMSNDPRQWLPRGFDETATHDWFQNHFGADEIAIVSWSDCDLDDPRVKTLATSLEESPYFERAVSGPRLLDSFAADPYQLSRERALPRIRRFLVGEDDRSTCIVLVTSERGKSDRVAAVDQITKRAAKLDITQSQLRLAGPTVDAAAIDVESRRLLFQLAGLSALVSFLIATVKLRSYKLSLIVLIGSVYGTGLALSVVYFTGGRMNLLMTMLPPLVYVLSISAAVHLVNYFRDATRKMSITAAAVEAIRSGWLPCVLAAATTAVGLASLSTSSIDPIREFGVYSAIGVLVSVILLLLYLPASIQFFRPPTTESRSSLTQWISLRQRLLRRFMPTITRYHAAVTVACLTFMLLCGLGLFRISSTVKLQDRFLPGSKVIRDYAWLEKNIGPMVPMEIVLRFPEDSQTTFIDRMKLMSKVQREIEAAEAVSTTSGINFAPPIRLGKGIHRVIERTQVEHKLRSRLVDAHYLAQTPQGELWRLSVRARALSDLDYGQFTAKLQSTVDPLLEGTSATSTYTGVIPLIYKAQRQLLTDLVRSFFMAFVAIGLVLFVVLRDLRAAAMTMIPNLFPAIVVFGGMAWAAVPVQIGSVMTASAALGIAVDDTIHFLTWFRRGLGQGLTRTEALNLAFERCAGAMTHTTLICSAGLLVFAASAFVPILHFAWLMVFLLVAALVGDLVLLPAILAGPCGRFFKSQDHQYMPASIKPDAGSIHNVPGLERVGEEVTAH